MLIKKADEIPSEVTPESTYLNRRNFMRAGILAATTAATGWVYRKVNSPSAFPFNAPPLENVAKTGAVPSGADPMVAKAFTTDEPKTPFDAITHYNNFYEFSTDKADVADEARKFVARPWTVAVGGMAGKPRVFDIDDILKRFSAEERVYRMRCVEGWSMVIPWNGFSLSKLLGEVEPLSAAKYVRFETLVDPQRMPGQRERVLNWPYVEGLRIDEAMHPLTILATGIYGRQMPPQDGAPIRLVVPWKYGFKGIKSIVKIDLVDQAPPTTWSGYAPDEYGFYANVNPEVDHPRWSQATEQRIGEYARRATLMFNGYGEQVARLYAGMDLRRNY